MSDPAGPRARHIWLAAAVLALLACYWLLPISGGVAVTLGRASQPPFWPRVQLERSGTKPDFLVAIQVRDVLPWAHMALTLDGQPAKLESWTADPGGTWTWHWTYSSPKTGAASDVAGATVIFYHDCDSGCVERGRTVVGGGSPRSTTTVASPAMHLPTKLGVVFADPERDWHGRSGWDAELTYARLAGQEYWGIDDLAARVHTEVAKGLRVLVRVDYDKGQSLPPTGDLLALAEYLHYAGRLARDERLGGVYGYVIGSGYNAFGANSLSPDRPVTPEWYARLFDGYGDSVSRTDNVVQTMRAENPRARILVGPVQPWSPDQSGQKPFMPSAPWLSYMNTLVADLDEAAQSEDAAGHPMAGPDGFAVQAPGRPDAPEAAGQAAEEPRLDLRNPAWDGARQGFRVYQDWLDIINSYPSTRGLPVYITSTNTYAPDVGTPPAQNYPPGWLTTALRVVDQEPQVFALCWFLDGPLGDTQWDWFALGQPTGRLIDAADEFDWLLQGKP